MDSYDPAEQDAFPDMRLVDPHETHDELYLLVHPGDSMLRTDIYENFGGAWSLAGLRTEDYTRYAGTLASRLRRADDRDVPVAVMYRGRTLDDTREFLGEHDDIVDAYIPTSSLSGYMVDDGPEMLARSLARLEPGGTIRVAGEMAGLCHDQAVEQVEDILNVLDPGATVREDLTFPEKRLERVNGTLYWEDSSTPRFPSKL